MGGRLHVVHRADMPTGSPIARLVAWRVHFDGPYRNIASPIQSNDPDHAFRSPIQIAHSARQFRSPSQMTHGEHPARNKQPAQGATMYTHARFTTHHTRPNLTLANPANPTNTGRPPRPSKPVRSPKVAAAWWRLGGVCLLSAAAWLPQPSQAWGLFSSSVSESGQSVRQARVLPAFTQLRVEGPFDVVAQPEQAPQAVVEADSNIAPWIETVVQGNTLVVQAKSGFRCNCKNRTRVTVGYQQLTGAQLRGSGDLRVSGLKAEAFTLALAGSGDAQLKESHIKQLDASLSGSGDIALDGQGDAVSISLAGSGDVHAFGWNSRSAQVRLAGSGDVDVEAQEALTVTIAGSGDVRYRGKPSQLRSQVSGSGTVQAAP
jgi:hypothetical protein